MKKSPILTLSQVVYTATQNLYCSVGHVSVGMDDTLVFLGLSAIGTVLYGVVFARLKVRSWLGAKRLAALEADIEDDDE